jgi:TPR repeat protein
MLPSMHALSRGLVLLAGLILAGCGPATHRDGAERPPATGTAAGAEERAHALMAGDPPDWEGARAAFAEAAAAGSPTAMSYLGWIHEHGHGVPVDGRQAALWYARAAELGAHDLAVKLGWMYLGGEGVPRDRVLAEHWFARAVDAGHSPGRIAWASVLIADAQGGLGVERVHEARGLLELALADGFPLAAFFLARLYIEGIGGHPVDDALAARYTRIGADDGNAQMQGWLALMYAEGRGLEADPVLACMWANLAAAGGDRLGNQIRVMLESELDPIQVAEARQRAVDWAMARR